MLEYEALLLTLQSLTRKLKSAREKLDDYTADYEEAKRIFQKESKDVEKLEAESLSAFFHRAIGKYDDKLDQEKQEQVEAKMNLDLAISLQLEALNQLSDLESEIQEKTAQANELKQQLLVTDPEFAQKITAEEQKRLELQQEEKEVEEAIRAGEVVLQSVDAALSELDTANSYSTWDMFTDSSLIMDMMKYNKIDSAERMLNQLEVHLARYEKELKDLTLENMLQYERISGMNKTFDIFFDNIFSDWNTKATIQKNISMIERLGDHVLDLQKYLHEKRDSLEKDIQLSKKHYG